MYVHPSVSPVSSLTPKQKAVENAEFAHDICKSQASSQVKVKTSEVLWEKKRKHAPLS